MRNLKKFLALVLAMMMALSLMVTVNAKNVEFTDSEKVNDAFEDDVTVLAGMKVFEGYTDGSFKPQNDITRAEAAAIVYRLATGDWEGKQAHLYADYQKFTDVTSDKWYAGYVNYCTNAEWIAGYGNGKFGPADKVTGYQAAAMILRAVGYGKNGEFQGASWQVQVANVTRSEGLLNNVDKTSYKNTLNAPATRELVAEILFQAANIPTVEWTMLGGYNKHNNLINKNDNNLNPSLGYKNYGLTSDTGIVLGNQATGEKNTLVGFVSYLGNVATGDPSTNQFIANGDGSYTYASTAATTGKTDNSGWQNITVPFDAKTGLDMFGHKATVWYDGRDNAKGYTITSSAVNEAANKTYAVLDQAVLDAYVYAESAELSKNDTVANVASSTTAAQLGKAANTAGFSVQVSTQASGANGANTTAATSEEYKRIDITKVKTTATATTADTSPVNMFYLVSNNKDKTVDVVVSLSAEVGKITELNLTAKDKYLTLGTTTGVTSSFNNGTAQQIKLANLTPDSVQKIGELVCAWEVKGTAKATPAAADYFYQLDNVKTTTKQVSTYKASTNNIDSAGNYAVNEVTFTDGTSMKLSGITRGNGSASKIISQALPIVTNEADASVNGVLDTNIKAGASYTVYEDVLGRFISMVPANTTTFIYGTFGDYEVGAVGTGTYDYYITGVGPDGNKIENHTLTAIEVSGTMTKIKDNVNATYNNSGGTTFPITRKDYGGTGNQISDGANTGFMINADGELSPYTGKKMNSTYNVTTDPHWTIKSSDTTLGVARVVSNSTTYMLTNNTQFYVVEGSGTATLKVTPYKGITALLDGGSSVVIDASSATIDDEVIFWTEEDLYGTTKTDSNRTVATVILSDTNLTRYGAQNMYFAAPSAAATGVKLAGAKATVEQYKLYNDGVASTYWVDTAAPGVAATGDATVGAFYTLVQIDTVAGQPIYKAEKQTVATNLSYAEGFNTGVTYKYVTVNTLNFANLTKGTGDLVFNVANAKICDVQFKEDPATADSRSEITSIAELNNAISVMNTAQGAAVYTVAVAVVYDNANVATVYITNIT